MDTLFYIMDFLKGAIGFALTMVMYYGILRYTLLTAEREDLNRVLDACVATRKEMKMSEDDKFELDFFIFKLKKELAKPMDIHAPHNHLMKDMWKDIKK